MVYQYDFLVIGAGVAGMSYALKVARANKGRVCMICKTSLEEANTSFAQGGVASVTNLELDNFDKHIEDTMIAGDYISDRKAVEQVVRMAPEQIKELVEWGVNFDKKEDGTFDLHREGGHSEFRILHHADDTGAEIQRGLMEAVRNNPNIDIKENHFAVEIITQHHYGWLRSRLSHDFQPRDCHWRWHCHGLSCQRNRCRHGIRTVPSDGTPQSERDAPRLPHHRGHARLWRHPETAQWRDRPCAAMAAS